MTTIKKLPIKKLIQPIKIIIEIVVYSYWDKTNGNNYCSAQCTVNNNYDNTQYYCFNYNTPEQQKRDIINDIVSKFKGLDKYTNLHYESQAIEQGILISSKVIEVNQRVCKQFGIPYVSKL